MTIIMVSLALNIIAGIFLLYIGYWVFIFIIGVVGNVFITDNNTKFTPTDDKLMKPTIQNPLPQSFSLQDFNSIISKYNSQMSSITDPQEVEATALLLDDTFRMRRRLFQFLLFLYDIFWNQSYVTEARTWWPTKLIPLNNIIVERNSGSEVRMTIKINNIIINYHQIESEEPYTTNENEVLVSYKKKDVYRSRFSLSEPFYFQKPKTIPKDVNLYLFKPSDWLFVLNSFLSEYEREYPHLLEMKTSSDKNQEVERLKSNFQS